MLLGKIRNKCKDWRGGGFCHCLQMIQLLSWKKKKKKKHQRNKINYREKKKRGE